MKKITCILLSLVITVGVFSQKPSELDYNTLKNQVKKSDEAIKNEKKNVKAKTWLNRGDVFLEAADINLKGLYGNMKPNEAVIVFGEPTEKESVVINKQPYEKWVYDRANIYFDSRSARFWEDTKPLREDALNVAFEAYKKAVELDEKGKMKESVKEKLKQLSGKYISLGAIAWEMGDYKKAFDAFGASLKVSEDKLVGKVDTAIYFNTALAADNAKLYKEALGYYKKALGLNYGKDVAVKDDAGLPKKDDSGQAITSSASNARLYVYIATCYTNLEDLDKTGEYLLKGAKLYPDNGEIVVELINYYLKTDQTMKALSYLDKAIKMEPTNATYYFAQGALFEKLREKERIDVKKILQDSLANREAKMEELKAKFKKTKSSKERYKIGGEQTELRKVIKQLQKDTLNVPVNDVMEDYTKKACASYEKAIELKSDYHSPLYNLGVIYYNKAQLERKAADLIDLNDTKAFNEQIKVACHVYKKSLEYFEKAHEIEPKDNVTLETLRNIYGVLKRDSESEAEKEQYGKLYKETKEKISNL